MPFYFKKIKIENVVDNSVGRAKRTDIAFHFTGKAKGKQNQRRASMAVSSISSSSLVPSLSLISSSSMNSKANFSFSFFNTGTNAFKLQSSKPLLSSTRVYAAPEVLDSPDSDEIPPPTPDDSDSTTLEVCILCICFRLSCVCLIMNLSFCEFRCRIWISQLKF